MMFFIFWIITLVWSVEAQQIQISSPTICRAKPDSKECYLALWRYAGLSYCPDTVKQYLGAPSNCSSTCATFRDSGCDLTVYKGGNFQNVEAFVYRLDRDVFVAFAGTDPTSWDIPALFSVLIPYQNGQYSQTKVAMGAYNHLDYIFTRIAQCLNKSGLFNAFSTADSAGKLYVIGHSLGGAMAQIAAVRFNLEYNVPAKAISVYSFNSIKSGNPAFAAQLDISTNNQARSIRETNDIATNFAPNGIKVWCSACQLPPRPGPTAWSCNQCLIQAGLLIRTDCGPAGFLPAELRAHSNIYGINFDCKINGSLPMIADWEPNCKDF